MAIEARNKTSRVAILTPYLHESLVEVCREGEKLSKNGEDFAKEQSEKYGYDADNFNGVNAFVTPERVVTLTIPEDYEPPTIVKAVMFPSPADLAISGTAGHMEGFADFMKKTHSGVIVARYSIFYGGPSEYSGRTPEEGGFALDIPKTVAAVRALLTDDKTLDAIAERDEARLRSALGRLNEKLEQPIIATPYLTEVLNIRRQ